SRSTASAASACLSRWRPSTHSSRIASFVASSAKAALKSAWSSSASAPASGAWRSSRGVGCEIGPFMLVTSAVLIDDVRDHVAVDELVLAACRDAQGGVAGAVDVAHGAEGVLVQERERVRGEQLAAAPCAFE